MFQGKVSQQINWKNRADNRWPSELICRPTNNMFLFFIFGICQGNNAKKVNCYCLFSARVSTKWLNLLRKICAIFAQFYCCELLRYFCAWNAMSFARFFAIFLRNLRKTGNSFCESCAWNEILVLRNFFAQFAQNRKF